MRIMSLGAALAAALSTCAAAGAGPRYSIVSRVRGADGYYDFATLDVAHHVLYVARGDGVLKADLASGVVTDRFAPAKRAHEVLVLDGGATLFVTDGGANIGRFVDAKDGHVLAEVPTGAKPDAALFDERSGRIAVMNADDGSITLVDARTRRAVGSIAVGGGLEFGVPDGRGGAYVNIEDRNSIARVDLIGARRTGTIALPGCEGPTGLASIAGGRGLVTACANGRALVVDSMTGRVVATLPIGGDPDAVLVDEGRGLAFIPCGGSGTLVALSIRDPDNVTVAGTIQTQIGAKTGAIDPADGRIYLPTATLGRPAPGAKRGAAVPGTFNILVLAPQP